MGNNFNNIYVDNCRNEWHIEYFNNQVQQSVLALSPTLLSQYLRKVELMERFGADLGMPHTRALGKGLFELRLKGKEGIARIFYCQVIGKRIVMLHCFRKKTLATPKSALDLVRKRLKKVIP